MLSTSPSTIDAWGVTVRMLIARATIAPIVLPDV